MKIERRLFIHEKSHWSYVCVLAERFEMKGWKVFFRPELNAIDILKYSYDGYDAVDDMEQIVEAVGLHTMTGTVRAIYDLNDPERQVRYNGW